MPIPAFLICPLLLFFAWSEASRPLLWIPADSSLAPQWHRQILSAVESGLGPEWECSAQRLREPAATLRTVLRRQRERLQLIVEIEYGPAFRTDRLGTSLDSAHQDSLSLQRTVALAGTDAVAALRDAFSKADNTSEDSLPSPLPPGRLRVEWLDSLSGAVWVDGEMRCAGLTLCEVSENNGLHWIAMRRNEFDLSPMWVRLPQGRQRFAFKPREQRIQSMRSEPGSCRDDYGKRICSNGFWVDTAEASRSSFLGQMGWEAPMYKVEKALRVSIAPPWVYAFLRWIPLLASTLS